jgi:hypothetical protein
MRDREAILFIWFLAAVAAVILRSRAVVAITVKTSPEVGAIQTRNAPQRIAGVPRGLPGWVA